MKALSVRQPFADNIARGIKTLEIRSWPTHYRGDLLICAAKKRHGDLPTGIAVAIVTVSDCRPCVPGDDDAGACCEPDEGDFAWVLTDVRPIKPFPVLGRLGLFDVPLPDGCAETRCEPATLR